MDDDGNLYLGLALIGSCVLVTVTGVLRFALSGFMARRTSDLIQSSALLPASLQILQSVAREAQLVLRTFWLFQILVITLIVSILCTSLGFNYWSFWISLPIVLVLLVAVQGISVILGRRYTRQIMQFWALPLISLTRMVSPLISRLNIHPNPDASSSLLDPLTPHDQIDSSGPSTSASLQAAEEVQMLRAVLELRGTQIKEVLVPRVDIIATEITDPLARVVELALLHGYSRIPVYEDTIDQIMGIVYARDLLQCLQDGNLESATLTEVVRPTMFVPESKGVYELLKEFQERHIHIAIVVDEYGGTAGLVTIEDLLEEIVGEIEDEFDREEPKMQKLSTGAAIVDARLSLDDLKELLEIDIPSQGFDTLGGFVYSNLGRVPNPGDQFTAQGVCVEVLSTNGRRIRKVKLTKVGDPLQTPRITLQKDS